MVLLINIFTLFLLLLLLPGSSVDRLLEAILTGAHPGHCEQIGAQSIEVLEDGQLEAVIEKWHQATFRPAADGPGQVQRGGGTPT